MCYGSWLSTWRVKSAPIFNLILYPSNYDNSCILALKEMRDFFRSSRDFKDLLYTVPWGTSTADDSFNNCSTLALCEYACRHCGTFSTILIPWLMAWWGSVSGIFLKWMPKALTSVCKILKELIMGLPIILIEPDRESTRNASRPNSTHMPSDCHSLGAEPSESPALTLPEITDTTPELIILTQWPSKYTISSQMKAAFITFEDTGNLLGPLTTSVALWDRVWR